MPTWRKVKESNPMAFTIHGFQDRFVSGDGTFQFDCGGE